MRMRSENLLYVYFLSAEGQTPNVTKAPPYVEFRGLTVTSTDPAKSDESLKGYQGFQIHMIRYEDLWNLVDTSRMCSNTEDVQQGLSKKEDHLILKRSPGQSLESVHVYRHQVSFYQKEPDEKQLVQGRGVYFLVLSNCGSFDKATISGEVVVRNSHGFLPGNEYQKMPFYGILAALCLGIFLVWSLLCLRWWKVLFNIHLAIGFVTFLGILESAVWFFYLSAWNKDGLASKPFFSISVLVSVTKSTLSYMLVLSACLGWGVTKPILDGGTICRISCISIVYIILNVVREVVLSFRHTQSVPIPFVLLCLLPVSMMNGGIFYWIFSALTNLMETLEAQGQKAKLALFKRLWWILVLSITFAVVVLLAQIFVFANDAEARWQEQWLVTDGAPQGGFLFILLAIMWLWAPNEDSQRFAYSAQLDEEQEGMGSVEKAEVMSNEDVDVIGARG
ncbi:unnamed protein product [Effrenium voratum]|nr:unnamed protein product [Effrenium voratum]